MTEDISVTVKLFATLKEYEKARSTIPVQKGAQSKRS